MQRNQQMKFHHTAMQGRQDGMQMILHGGVQ